MTIEPKLMSAEELECLRVLGEDCEVLDTDDIHSLLAHIAAQEQRIEALELQRHTAELSNGHLAEQSAAQEQRIAELEARPTHCPGCEVNHP